MALSFSGLVMHAKLKGTMKSEGSRCQGRDMPCSAGYGCRG